jgi:curved DNA-binding protein CbpA
MSDRRPFDPYAVLGVERGATTVQVARAHRRLAKRHHPDLHPLETIDADERMRRINEAWQILSNPIRRADYDRAHPSAGTPASSHWAASRHAVRPAAPTSTRTWASWRATAAETRAAPRTVREPGEIPIPRTRRPPRPSAADADGFLASGWAAVLVAAVVIVLLLLAAFVRNIT